MRSSNPALITNPFSKSGLSTEAESMTIGGTVNKTAILLLLVALPAAFIWQKFFFSSGNAAAVQSWMFFGIIGGLILGFATIFKAHWAPITAPLYAVMQGLFLGGISALFEQQYPGIVMQAVSLTFTTLIIMLASYQAGWVRATERFKWGVIAATGGVALVYAVSFILSLFKVHVSFIADSSLFSIIFSCVVVAIAALNFILDFDLIEQGARVRAPKYMEWYGAFALMVTLIWLYVEILRLLSKLNSRR